MALPTFAVRRGSIEIEGQAVGFRSLTRSEAVKIKTDFDVNEGEVWMVACGMDVSMDEARAWRDSSPSDSVQQLLEAIADLSGLLPKVKASADKNTGNEPS